MSDQKFEFTTPTGRIVQGDLYTANDKDSDGRPLLNRQGQPKKQYFVAIAIPKTQADAAPLVQLQQAGWNGQPIQVPGFVCSPWGQQFLQAAFSDPNLNPGTQMPRDTRFAWKVVDGDSTELGGGTPPKKICDYEGFKGCWIVKFTTIFPIRCYDTSFKPLPEDAIKRGYFVQIAGSVSHNGDRQKPGLYVNPDHVVLIAYGQEIQGFVSDPSTRGFNLSAPLPPGASATPPAALPVGAPGMPAGAPLPVPSVAVPAPVAMVPAPTVSAAGPMVTVAPNLGFLPGVGAAVPMGQLGIAPAPAAVGPGNPVLIPPPPPPVAAGPQMTAKANGATYAQFKAQGWPDDQLRAQGYMI